MLEIKEETKVQGHENLGMFILVICSHGNKGDIFLDSQCQPVDLAVVKNMLCCKNFPYMAGKPKLIIFQACSGGKLLKSFKYLVH